MKKSVLVLAIAATFAPVLAQAEAGDWVVRLRATNINPSESSKLGEKTAQAYGADTATALYGSTSANLQVDSNTIPELDISYYVTKNIALELILALGTKHDVKTSANGNGATLLSRKLGEVNLLPPTLTAQWHFNPDQTFDPYVGAGISYVRAMDNGLTARTALGDGAIRIDRSNWGPALQAGFDVNLQDGWLVNFDVKKIWFDTDVKLNGAILGLPGYRKIDSLDIDPLVVSVGIGKKF
ncbi:MAG: OmpW family outer membrane protein [Methylotenera sp.]|nr:OmpW family outer membrane protein [Methylotenera sp.]MDP2402724.1 OmpW family outer membrane protein [Methylotenera sp.]MDP3094407.1 OmpW family outer membrane protein [Methylotenera sp.]MDZ4222113.1 OmpW family outer membrane protein [Methylotenera sp.]